MIHIVGVGPGSLEWMTQEGQRVLSSAQVVVAGARLLEALPLRAETRRVELPAAGMADALAGVLEREAARGDVVLAVSGDPGFYSLARRAIAHFGRENIRIVPGISSLQILSARLGRSWVNVRTATIHGREYPDRAELRRDLGRAPALAVLLGGADDAVAHMRWLAEDAELAEAWAAVGWDLGLPKEQVFDAPTLRDLLRCPYIGRLALLWLERKDRGGENV